MNLYATAFDGLAADYDRTFGAEPATKRLRQVVWTELSRRFAAGDLALDVGCGTGEDAVFLATSGVRVFATDVSPAMVRLAAAKLASHPGSAAAVRDARTLPRTLPGLLGAGSGAPPLAGIVSNFGALNCLPTLEPLQQIAEAHVRPGGALVLVLINRYYLRELGRGVWRRLRPSGTDVNCGSRRVPVYYHPPRALRWPGFTVERLAGLAVFGRSDVHDWPPWNRLGDHYLAVLRKG